MLLVGVGLYGSLVVKKLYGTKVGIKAEGLMYGLRLARQWSLPTNATRIAEVRATLHTSPA
jgi:hypothetical protein